MNLDDLIRYDPSTRQLHAGGETQTIEDLEVAEWLRQKQVANDLIELANYAEVLQWNNGQHLTIHTYQGLNPQRFESQDHMYRHLLQMVGVGEDATDTVLGMINPDKLVEHAEAKLKVKVLNGQNLINVM
jgi:hypothetical protein